MLPRPPPPSTPMHRSRSTSSPTTGLSHDRSITQWQPGSSGRPSPGFSGPAPGSVEAVRDATNKRIANRRMKAGLGVVLRHPDIKTGLVDARRERSSVVVGCSPSTDPRCRLPPSTDPRRRLPPVLGEHPTADSSHSTGGAGST